MNQIQIPAMLFNTDVYLYTEVIMGEAISLIFSQKLECHFSPRNKNIWIRKEVKVVIRWGDVSGFRAEKQAKSRLIKTSSIRDLSVLPWMWLSRPII